MEKGPRLWREPFSEVCGSGAQGAITDFVIAGEGVKTNYGNLELAGCC